MADLERMRELIEFTRERAVEQRTFTGVFILKDGAVIAREVSTIHKDRNCLAHAELKAIASASKALGGPNLQGCELYTTQKPCAMCASAIVWSGIKSVFYGVPTNHHWTDDGGIREFFSRYGVACEGPVLEAECREIDDLLRRNGI